MDTLTHALSGALSARATAPQAGTPGALPLARRVGIGFVAGAFPDLDVVASLVSPLSYLYYHRGITHSILLLPVWATLLALLCALIWRRGPRWTAYWGVIALALAIHIVGDWITSFGIMLFAPFSDVRYELSTTFIIDPWFTAIIVAGLTVSAVWRRSRAPAVAGLAVLAGYVGLQFALQQRAIEFGAAYARAAGLPAATVTAQPRPVSPFNWIVVVSEGERYRYSFINLIRTEPVRLPSDAGFFRRLAAPYLPLDQAVWLETPRFGTAPAEAALAREVWSHPQFAFFRWFAYFPVLHAVTSGNPETCVWFQDLRFLTPGRTRWPFRYGLCREAGGEWLPFQLEGDERLRIY